MGLQKNSKYLIIFSLMLSSCLSNKKIVYIQSDKFKVNDPSIINRVRESYKIQPFDILSINVKSSDQDAADAFNLVSGANGAFGGLVGETGLFVQGYSVNEIGEINLPYIGKMNVLNKTIIEITDMVKQALDKYLKDAVINIKLVSFKISVIGEVVKPGQHRIFNEQLTIFEAISLAGDLNEFANRNNVKLIRQSAQGTEIVLLDLTKPQIIETKYYYLFPNDVVYVEPRKGQAFRRNLNLLNFVFNGVSTLVLLLTFIAR